MFSKLLAVVSLLLFFVGTSHAAATDQSVLSCTPIEVEPNTPVTCTIFVRDIVQEPTTLFSVTDFSIVATPSILQTVVTVSPLVIGDDITTAVFTINVAAGTKVAVKVYLRSSGTEIRGSGAVLSILVWPATRVGPITCSTDNFVNGKLPLRAWTICSADVSGNNDLPAAVHGSDVFFAEDHFAGTFLFLSGAKQLKFNFSASSAITSTFDSFLLRVTISSSDAVYTVAIPMAYPMLPATTASTLQCAAGASTTYCYLYSRDRLGPVAFSSAQFGILFERLDGDVSASSWVVSTSDMNVTVSSVDGQGSVGKVAWKLAVNNRISTQRIRLQVSKVDIQGSPFVFTAGSAPTPSNVVFRSCVQQYVAAGNKTTCTLDLLNGVTGDSAYYVLSSSQGAQLTDLAYTAQDPQYGNPIMTFTYNAPTPSVRVEDLVGVSVSQQPVTNSPYRVVVYPVTSVVNPVDGTKGVPAMIALGMLFYGSAMAIGMYLFVSRTQRLMRVQNAKIEHGHNAAASAKKAASEAQVELKEQPQPATTKTVASASTSFDQKPLGSSSLGVKEVPMPPTPPQNIPQQPSLGSSVSKGDPLESTLGHAVANNNNNNNNSIVEQTTVVFTTRRRDDDSDSDE